jgi:hypothetical protein
MHKKKTFFALIMVNPKKKKRTKRNEIEYKEELQKILSNEKARIQSFDPLAYNVP